MTVGPLLIAAGMLLFTRVQGNGDYITQVLPAVLVLGLGLATNVAPLTATALSAAPAEHSGIASAVNNDVARSASLIAVAVLPTLAGLTGDAYLHPAALTQGFHTAMTISAVAAAAGGILAAATIRNPLRRPRPRAEPAPAGSPGRSPLQTPPPRAPPSRRAPPRQRPRRRPPQARPRSATCTAAPWTARRSAPPSTSHSSPSSPRSQPVSGRRDPAAPSPATRDFILACGTHYQNELVLWHTRPIDITPCATGPESGAGRRGPSSPLGPALDV